MCRKSDLFWNNEGLSYVSPERMQQLTKMWWTWLEDLKKGGHLVQAGERMDGTGKVVRGKAKTVTDGPYAEAKDTIGGYMLVQATDMAQALELSKGCPILDGDGMVEVRPIVRTGPGCGGCFDDASPSYNRLNVAARDGISRP
jgi:hypothetical protein